MWQRNEDSHDVEGGGRERRGWEGGGGVGSGCESKLDDVDGFVEFAEGAVEPVERGTRPSGG